MNKLLILSRDATIYRELIEKEELPDLTIVATSQPQEAITIVSDCDLIFGEPHLISQVIAYFPLVKWIQTTWAGVDPLLAPNLRRDYILTNARNVYGPMMSEYVFGYLLHIERKILARWQSQLEAKWDPSPYGTLKGKTLGIMGVGTIGSYLANTAHHFEMRVYGFTRRSETCPDIDRYFHMKSILDFAAELDYLVCSLPGTQATKNIVNARFLAALPSSAWLVNVGRGSTVNEIDLVNTLNAGTLAGAVLDVFIKEPLPESHPLWKTPNTYITAHTAARNNPTDIALLFINNYKLFVRGEPLLYQVDFEQQY